MKLIFSTLLVSLLLGTAVFGQTAALVAQPQTFHVKGTITDPLGVRIPGAQVTFGSQETSKTVTTNRTGSYQAELPLGVYGMIAMRPGHDFMVYHRPEFRVTSPITLIWNLTFFPENREPCQIPVKPATSDEWRAVVKSYCGSEDSFPIPSWDGIPFQLFVRYPRRKPDGISYTFSGKKARRYRVPVFAAYNLLSLQADRIVYDPQQNTLDASGKVVIEDESGSHHADSVKLKLESGQATPLR